ncbi:hypothetical protein SO802_030532 [Lithocarpus litseifolius]|uniref:Uncharacterized protein n=1 Tax=Lithocarpus litseifolius TaxID=425828 RepID=A0AAW2BHZ8_9ROSI
MEWEASKARKIMSGIGVKNRRSLLSYLHEILDQRRWSLYLVIHGHLLLGIIMSSLSKLKLSSSFHLEFEGDVKGVKPSSWCASKEYYLVLQSQLTMVYCMDTALAQLLQTRISLQFHITGTISIDAQIRAVEDLKLPHE